MNKFEEYLKDKGFEVRVMPGTTRTAVEAAEAIGCTVAEIAKSIIFKDEDGEAVLVVACGTNRINEDLISQYIGKKIGKADADFVREKTGFVIGGVPPFGHKEKIKTFIDEELMNYQDIWAAAGTPFAVFRLTPQKLVLMSHGEAHRVKANNLLL